MRRLRVALAQIDTTVGDLDGNAAKIIEWTERARGLGADVVAFPELAVAGYPPEDLVLRRAFGEDKLKALERVGGATRGITSVVGLVEINDDVYNAASIIADVSVRHRYTKTSLPI